MNPLPQSLGRSAFVTEPDSGIGAYSAKGKQVSALANMPFIPSMRPDD